MDAIKSALTKIVDNKNLSADEMTQVTQCIMTGKATPAQIGAFLMGMRMKGETVVEIAAAVKVMREFATKVNVDHPKLVDVVGTGGDSSHTFNISTACTFVVAAAGAVVAKHGSRSISSKSGSADLLEAAGVNIMLNSDQVAECIKNIGLGFMFSQQHHPAVKYVVGPRKELGLRSLFNITGPLTNPAGAKHQLFGVFDKKWLQPIAEVLQELGSSHVLVVHSQDGLDEISIAAPTDVAELKDNKITRYQITPEQFGIERRSLDAIKVKTPQESLQIIQQVLDNQAGPACDIVLLNAGAALYAADLVDDIAAGVEKAKAVIEEGLAKQKLAQLIKETKQWKTNSP